MTQENEDKGSLKIKDYLVKRTSRKTQVNEKIVDTIIHFQFTEVLEAIHNHNTIEVSGLFTLRVSKEESRAKNEETQ